VRFDPQPGCGLCRVVGRFFQRKILHPVQLEGCTLILIAMVLVPMKIQKKRNK
jgi:hypothetical protein